MMLHVPIFMDNGINYIFTKQQLVHQYGAIIIGIYFIMVASQPQCYDHHS